MTALGLLTNTLMGLVGAFPQLIIGMITDCISGSARTLSTLTGTARVALSPLLSLYAPMNRHALGLFCMILIGGDAGEGIFVVLDAVDIDRSFARD